MDSSSISEHTFLYLLEANPGGSPCNVLKFVIGETNFDRGAVILRSQYPNTRIFNVTAMIRPMISNWCKRRQGTPRRK